MSYTYNADNEQTSMTDGAGDTTKYTYDGVGNQTQVTNPLGNTTTNSYNPQGLLLSTTNALNGTTSYTYNLAGWQTSETDPDGNFTQYGYNAVDEQIAETNPLGYQETFSYDQAGDLTGQTDFDGQQTQYSYNESGWQTGETWLNSQDQSIYQATYTYDTAGWQTSAQDPNSQYSYSYNADGQVTQTVVTYPGVSSSPLVTLSYGYGTLGNRTSLTDSLGGKLTYTYNGESELTGETFSLNGTTDAQLSLTYDSQERLSGITRTGGMMGDTISSSYSYDSASRLTNITYKDTTKSTTLASYTYGYNAGGDVTIYQDNSGNSLTYGYDANDELTSATGTLAGSSYTFTYNYDVNGNRTSTSTDVNGSVTSATYTTGTGNELLNDGTYTYTYDKNGNMLTKTDTATGDEWFYSWNYNNQMTEAVEKTSGGVVENDEKYNYDVEGRLIGVNVNGTQQRWTVYDGTNAYMDFNGAGTTVTERYVTNPMEYGTLYARVSGSGAADWYVTDMLGSVRQIVSTSGNVLDSIVYDPWGNIVSESNSSNGDRFKFDGGQYDSIQQTYLFNARWNNPQDGRWESPDTLGLSQGSNLYLYVSNRPIYLKDPSGHQAQPPKIVPGITLSNNTGPQRVSYCPPFVEWTMDYTPPKNPKSGFIVQHIVRSTTIENSVGDIIFNQKVSFWEAYPINDPKNPKFAPVFTDTFSFEGPAGTSGIFTISGYAVYVTNWRPTPWNPANPMQSGWVSPGQKGHQGSAGSLPTSDDKPPWWKETDGVWRKLIFTWNCSVLCGGGDNNEGSVTAIASNDTI